MEKCCLHLRGGSGEHDFLDLDTDSEEVTPRNLKKAEQPKGNGEEWSSTSTPDEDKAVGVWSAESSIRPDSVPSEGQSHSSSAASSTGLGVHGNCTWDRIKQIGIPVFEIPGLKKAANEAKMLRQSRDFAEQAMDWKREEREAVAAETERRSVVRERGRQQGLWGSDEGAQIEGEPCKACGRVLCCCEHLAEEEELQRRGIEDPFERIKDRHILMPGQATPPPASPPSVPPPSPSPRRSAEGGCGRAGGWAGEWGLRLQLWNSLVVC